MRTFQDFMFIAEAAYDAEVMKSSQVRTLGPGGRLRPERKKTAAEKKRFKSVKDPKTGKITRVPVDYKERSDIGEPKQVSKTVQQPEQERGSADVKARAAAAAKAERAAAARARIAARKAGAPAPAAKPSAKEAEKEATKLLSKKGPAKKEPSGDKEDHMIKGSLLPKGEKRPYTREEKKKITRTGKRLQADLQKGKERPASHYQSSLTGEK